MRDVRFVLVRPGDSANVGATARALKNMGFSELWLVAPRTLDAASARRLAHGAVDVLRAARVTASLGDALADCRWSVGATRRAGRRRAATLAPRSFAETACAHPERRPLAVVLGPEEDGLSASEVALCNDIVRIPASAAQPSLNLAQAALLLAYELHLSTLDAATSSQGAASTEAPAEEVEQLYAHLEAALLAVGFVRPDTAPHRILALRRILGRARLRPGDVRLLRGICRQILWATDRGGAGAASRLAPGGLTAPERPRIFP